MIERLIGWLAHAKPPVPAVEAVPLDSLTLASAKRQMERDLRAAGHTRKSAMTLTVDHFENLLKGER